MRRVANTADTLSGVLPSTNVLMTVPLPCVDTDTPTLETQADLRSTPTPGAPPGRPHLPPAPSSRARAKTADVSPGPFIVHDLIRPYARRPVAEAKPSQVCRLPAQHQPILGALRRSRPSRPVPLLIQSAGVRASRTPLALRSREPIVMKQRLRSRTAGCCSTQWMPSLSINGVRAFVVRAGSASFGLQLAIWSPRSRPVRR